MTDNAVKEICATIQVLTKSLQHTNYGTLESATIRDAIERLSQALLNHSLGEK